MARTSVHERDDEMRLFLFACCVMAVAASNGMSQEAAVVEVSPPSTPTVGSVLEPSGDLELFQRAPSTWTGNFFNAPVEASKNQEQFVVKDVTVFPGLSGNQVWVELGGKSGISAGGQCADSSCWALYGTVDKGSNLVFDPNFETIIQNEADGPS